MNRLFVWLTAVVLLSVNVASDARVLTREFLLGTDQLSSPLSMSEFTPPSSGVAAPAKFEGWLRLSREKSLGALKVHRDVFGAARKSRGAIGHLPQLDFEFVQDGDVIIPVRRGHVQSDDAYWEFIVEPGVAWRESGDDGMSRTALPFALQERNANCVHNGVLTFLFDERSVSRVAYQIGSETCAYFQADFWGVLPASAVRFMPEEREAVVAAFRREVAARLPVKPIEALGSDFPGANAGRFGSRDEIAPADMTAFGFVIDGVHYTGGCATRYGPYPFCDVLDLPSYSLAKTIVAGFAALRLERLYSGTLQRQISAYVPECSQRHEWQSVTFGDALDMATGNFTDPAYEVDESAPATIDFFLVEDHAAKIHMACGQHDRRATPGTKWVYHTTDTYILGSALSAYVRDRVGEGADFYDDILVRGLWQPLQLSPLMSTTRRTRDGRRQPFTGWGLIFHRDDIARIGQFLTRDRGRLNGTAFFDANALEAAMQRNPADTGLPAIDASFRYNNGFWAHDISRYLGCANPVWVPYMAGYGGINVLLFPNNTVYYYFSDGGTFRWSGAALESNRIRNMCKAAR
ncbi:MAG TPA: hypothetical protein VGE08_00155 [Steroidobacter sp.]|uniref:hypothetical protein n=1 Tax=Steroidobacter sp. TaxID=1978227 RepID=UPI002ED8B7B6